MKKIAGHIVAPFTPMQADGTINFSLIKEYAEFIIRNGIEGVFLCGTTGEGALLSREERMQVVEKWKDAIKGRIKMIVHVAHTSYAEAVILAKHAKEQGAYAISSMAPLFLKPNSAKELADYCKKIADATPELPFYYYHIPAVTSVDVSMLKLLEEANERIPNFGGLKYTKSDLFEYSLCRKYKDGKYEILFGLDEIYLSALPFGMSGGVGGTYNHCFNLYPKIKEAYKKGDMKTALELQNKSQDFIQILIKYGGNVIAGKRMMRFMGLDMGPNRTPVRTISEEETEKMKKELQEIGFFDFCNK